MSSPIPSEDGYSADSERSAPAATTSRSGNSGGHQGSAPAASDSRSGYSGDDEGSLRASSPANSVNSQGGSQVSASRSEETDASVRSNGSYKWYARRVGQDVEMVPFDASEREQNENSAAVPEPPTPDAEIVVSDDGEVRAIEIVDTHQPSDAEPQVVEGQKVTPIATATARSWSLSRAGKWVQNNPFSVASYLAAGAGLAAAGTATAALIKPGQPVNVATAALGGVGGLTNMGTAVVHLVQKYDGKPIGTPDLDAAREHNNTTVVWSAVGQFAGGGLNTVSAVLNAVAEGKAMDPHTAMVYKAAAVAAGWVGTTLASQGQAHLDAVPNIRVILEDTKYATESPTQQSPTASAVLATPFGAGAGVEDPNLRPHPQRRQALNVPAAAPSSSSPKAPTTGR